MHLLIEIRDGRFLINFYFHCARQYDPSNVRSVDAALAFAEKRRAEHGERVCPGTIKNNEGGKLQVVNSKKLNKFSSDKVLVCENLKTKPLSEYRTCNFDSTTPGAVSADFNRSEVILNRFHLFFLPRFTLTTH